MQMERNSIPGGRNRMYSHRAQRRIVTWYSLGILAAQACPQSPVTQKDKRQLRAALPGHGSLHPRGSLPSPSTSQRPKPMSPPSGLNPFHREEPFPVHTHTASWHGARKCSEAWSLCTPVRTLGS